MRENLPGGYGYTAGGQPAVRLNTAFDSVTLYGEDPPLIATILEHVRRREALIGNTSRSPPALQAEPTLT